MTRRYDREEQDGIVRRLHQEDFCQLLKCRPEIKYQDQGGPSIVECTKLLLSTRLPLSDVISFVNRCVFNFIVGNGDAHGKNFSILYRDGTPRLAPVYDVICTTVYPPIAKKMSMKYDGKFEFHWITPGKIARTFVRAGIRENVVRDAVSRQCALVKDNLPALVDEANATNPSPIYHDVVDGIYRRLHQLN